jgi:hypothetical protein
MHDVLQAALAFPTVIYTVALGILLVYWLFVMLGALDIDLFGADADVGDVGDVGAVADVGDAGDAGGFFQAAGALGLGRVPLTVGLTTVVLIAWVVCLLATHYLIGAGGGVSLWLVGPGVFVGAFLVGVIAGSFSVRPLIPLFSTQSGKRRTDYVGSTCTITTGRVDAGFGQATVVEGGDVLVVPVRCDRPEAELGRGLQALIIDYDKKRQAYVIVPIPAEIEANGSREESR